MRHDKGDGFFAVPVVAGGLAYSDVSRVIGPKAGLNDLSVFNLHREAVNRLKRRSSRQD